MSVLSQNGPQELKDKILDKAPLSIPGERWELIKYPKDTGKHHYYISDYGRIKRITKINGAERLLKGSLGREGYKMLNIRLFDGSRSTRYIHKLVIETFFANIILEKRFVIHVDYDKQNNKLLNLAVVDEESKNAHLKSNPHYIATQLKKNKLNEAKVKIIKRMLTRGKMKHRMIAKKFDISITQLKRIERGENWGSVSAD